MKTYQQCYATHPPLTIVKDGVEYLIYGGSCSTPQVTNAEVYVGFDYSMRTTSKAFPWEAGDDFLFHIPDMGVPEIEPFRKLIEYLSVQLIALKMVHIGCIGGHGRTGTVLAALVTYMTGNKDSITYVRKNYCEKAVESTTQVRFLAEHFGILEAGPSKSVSTSTHGSSEWYRDKGYPVAPHKNSKMYETERERKTKASFSSPKGVFNATPISGPSSIWGSGVIFDKLKKSVII